MKRIRLIEAFFLSIMVITMTQVAKAQATAPTLRQAPQTGATPIHSGTCSFPQTPEDVDGLQLLLDVKAGTLAQRQAEFNAYERCAESGNLYYQSVIGSLYFMGEHLPDALTTRNPDKARLYLSNAAANGQILDMAKMAELEFAEQHYEAAMVWAQLYGHYDNLLPSANKPSYGYLAELLKRLSEQVRESEMPNIMNDVRAFIAQYDKAIHSDLDQWLVSPAADDLRWASTDITGPSSSYTGERPRSCFSEFLMAFRPDGSAADAWMIYALPDIQIGKQLLHGAMRMRLVPVSKPGLRYVHVPIIYDDNLYGIKESSTH